MITFIAVAIFFIGAFFGKYVFWRRYAETIFKQLLKNVPSKNYLDLELATTEQILHELFRRPNTRLMILIPEEKGHNLLVNIHSLNVSPDMALAILKKTYEGIGGSDGDDDEKDRDF